MRNTGLTIQDQKLINSSCQDIHKLETYGITDKELRQRVYMLGLFTFRQFHKAGTPSDFLSPRIISREVIAR